MRVPIAVAVAVASLLLSACGTVRAPIAYRDDARELPALEHPEGRSTAQILEYGFDALSARLHLVQGARERIDLQYYIWHPDTSGRVLMRAVLAAADRGVPVRIIVDGLGAKDALPHLRRLTVHPGIEVRVFNHLGAGLARLGNVLRIDHLQRRMHNKLLVVDERYAVTGGRNLGDDYFWTDGEMAFIDLDLLATGPVVGEAVASFERYWASPRVAGLDTIYAPHGEGQLDALRRELAAMEAPELVAERVNAAIAYDALRAPRSPDCGPFVGDIHFYADDPEKTDPDLTPEERADLLMMNAVIARLDELQVERRRLDIANAYFIPGDGEIDTLRRLRDGGSEIRVLTNSLMSTDVPMVHAAYAERREELLRMGVQLWELRAFAIKHGDQDYHDTLALHAKVMVMDDDISIIGSSNLDPRSRELNCELAVLIRNADCAAKLRGAMDRMCDPSRSFALEADPDSGSGIRWRWVDGGEERSSGHEPNRTLWRGFLQNVYSVVVPDSVL